MSLFYLYPFKFAVKLQIIQFENAIIGHIQVGQIRGSFWPSDWGKSARPSIFSLVCSTLPPPRPQIT